MVVTVKEMSNDGYVWLVSKDTRYYKAWGGSNRVTKANLFTCMNELTTWCNNELNEEMLFEVEG